MSGGGEETGEQHGGEQQHQHVDAATAHEFALAHTVKVHLAVRLVTNFAQQWLTLSTRSKLSGAKGSASWLGR